ncbi:MAG: lipid-A-disaccharide synthase, partial [Mailhella sp.]|nr:lipid-A-disaccharide synthase [Mailhella sp.]
RVKFLREHVRRIFSILPFEVGFYRSHGMEVTYVGNPLVDLVDYESIKEISPVKGRIGLMPGSRRKEIESLLPEFSRAASLLAERFPGLTFHCIRSGNFTEERLRSLWSSSVPLVIENPEGRYRFMRSCEFILAASGTATLETGLAGVPTLVAYKVSPLSYWVATHMLKVRWISLTNLILNRCAFPEHIEKAADAEPLAERMGSWLENPGILETMRKDTEELRTLCGEPGSALRAAAALWSELQR